MTRRDELTYAALFAAILLGAWIDGVWAWREVVL